MSDATVAPITDEELALLEVTVQAHTKFMSTKDVERLVRAFPSLVSRLRAAEARAEKAERERGALVAKVHEVYAQGHNGPLWKVREWMNAHVTGAKNEGKGG